MGIFAKKEAETREMLDEGALDTSLRAAMGGTKVGTEDGALEIPAVAASVSFLSGIIATLPVKLYRHRGKNTQEVTKDYRLALLNDDTGDTLDAIEWKKAMIRDYLVRGNGYTAVLWDRNTIRKICYVNPDYVSYTKDIDPVEKDGKFYINQKEWRPDVLFRILRNTKDGFRGYGVLDENPTQLSVVLNTMKYENRMVRTGAKKGFLKVQAGKKVTQEVINSLRKSWNKLYGNDSDENTVVLNDGIEFQDAGQTAVDSQLNQNKATNDHEIYQIFGIVPSVIEGGASADDLKNTVRFGIRPIVRALQSAINRFCLLEEEKGVLEFEIDMDDLDNTDMLTRYQAYEVAVRNGWMQLDEVRNQEGKNPLGLEFVRLGLDTVIYDPKSKQMYTPNTKEWTSINEAMKGGEKDESRDSIQSENGQEGTGGDGLRERGGPGQQDTA